MVQDIPASDASYSLLDVGLYLTMHGYNWFWVGFVLMISSLLLTVLLDLIVSGSYQSVVRTADSVGQNTHPIQCATQRPRGIRLFHQIAVVVLTTASLAYFSMALDFSTSFRNPSAIYGY
jgi:bacteriorhodopsin